MMFIQGWRGRMGIRVGVWSQRVGPKCIKHLGVRLKTSLEEIPARREELPIHHAIAARSIRNARQR